MKPITFISIRFPNLRVSLQDGTYAEFTNSKYTTDNPAIIKRLIESPTYNTAHGYETPGKNYIITLEGDIIDVIDRYRGDKAKYKPELTKEVSIIVGTHNNPDCIKDCLDSLYKHTPGGYQLIVIANATDPKSLEIIRSFKKKLGKDMVVIENKENKGFSEFNNQGVKSADRKYVLYLNDDTIVRPCWLESMVYLMRINPETGIVGKRSLTLDRKPQDHCETPHSGEAEVAYGHCLLIEKGYAWLDEKAFPNYGWEDFDLNWRMKGLGFKILIEREWPIIHKRHKSVNKIPDRLGVFGKNQATFETRVRTGYYNRLTS